MNLFKKNKKKPSEPKTERAEILGGNASSFSPFTGSAYENDVFRSGVDAIARNAGKLKGKHVIGAKDNQRTDGDGRINRILQIQPNPYMSAYDMIYKMVTQYYIHNNAFAVLERDGRGNLKAVYPMNPTHVDFLEDETGTIFCRFYFQNGNESLFPYSDIIHIRRYFNSKTLLGDDNTAITPALELAQTENEGIINGIKSGAHVRGLLKVNQTISSDTLKDTRDKFMKDYMAMDNDGGVIVTNDTMEYKPIDLKPVMLEADQQKEIKIKIFNYLGIDESIVNSTYTENGWGAFYESVIEPIAVQLGLEFTRKLFNDREQAFGNIIVFDSGRMQFSSTDTKTKLLKEIMPMGLLTINQALDILNLPTVEDGDRRLQTLNVVNADKADQYQLSDKGGTQE